MIQFARVILISQDNYLLPVDFVCEHALKKQTVLQKVDYSCQSVNTTERAPRKCYANELQISYLYI